MAAPSIQQSSNSKRAAAFCGDFTRKTAKRMKPELLSLLPCLSWEYFTIPADRSLSLAVYHQHPGCSGKHRARLIPSARKAEKPQGQGKFLLQPVGSKADSFPEKPALPSPPKMYIPISIETPLNITIPYCIQDTLKFLPENHSSPSSPLWGLWGHLVRDTAAENPQKFSKPSKTARFTKN